MGPIWVVRAWPSCSALVAPGGGVRLGASLPAVMRPGRRNQATSRDLVDASAGGGRRAAWRRHVRSARRTFVAHGLAGSEPGGLGSNAGLPEIRTAGSAVVVSAAPCGRDLGRQAATLEGLPGARGASGCRNGGLDRRRCGVGNSAARPRASWRWYPYATVHGFNRAGLRGVRRRWRSSWLQTTEHSCGLGPWWRGTVRHGVVG